MGSLCLFTRQQAFKMGYFYCLRIKNSKILNFKNFKNCALKVCALKIIFMQYLVSVTWETQSSILKAKLHLLT